MAVKVLCIGKTSEAYLQNGMQIYFKRLRKYGVIHWLELADVKKNLFHTPEELMKLEAAVFNAKLTSTDFVVALDEKGDTFTSRDFASKWNALTAQNSSVVVLIGGAFGFDKEFRKRFNFSISLSDMTFSHQLVRLLFLEQLYRAQTILHGEPYHND